MYSAVDRLDRLLNSLASSEQRSSISLDKNQSLSDMADKEKKKNDLINKSSVFNPTLSVQLPQQQLTRQQQISRFRNYSDITRSRMCMESCIEARKALDKLECRLMVLRDVPEDNYNSTTIKDYYDDLVSIAVNDLECLMQDTIDRCRNIEDD